jgi:hypothetical protein
VAVSLPPRRGDVCRGGCFSNQPLTKVVLCDSVLPFYYVLQGVCSYETFFSVECLLPIVGDGKRAFSSLSYSSSGNDPASTVDVLMKASYSNGAWNSGQFQSSTAATAGMTLGWIDAGTSVNVKITAIGDVNMDGVVNSADLGLVTLNYGLSGSSAVWATGDVNYDGVVNLAIQRVKGC